MDYFNAKILGCKIHDVSKSISINFQKSPEDDDESDKHLEARDRRYSCLKKSIASQTHFGCGGKCTVSMLKSVEEKTR